MKQGCYTFPSGPKLRQQLAVVIKSYRQSLRMPLDEAAKRAGVHKTTWKRWEQGRQVPLTLIWPNGKPTMLVCIAKALGVRPNYLLRKAKIDRALSSIRFTR